MLTGWAGMTVLLASRLRGPVELLPPVRERVSELRCGARASPQAGPRAITDARRRPHRGKGGGAVHDPAASLRPPYPVRFL